MKLVAEIKSTFCGVDVTELESCPLTLEVLFRQSGSVVTLTADDETNRFCASYPALVRDGRGGWKKHEGYSENMLKAGLFWVLRQVAKKGRVEPEIAD
jgi:hypothetical protein